MLQVFPIPTEAKQGRGENSYKKNHFQEKHAPIHVNITRTQNIAWFKKVAAFLFNAKEETQVWGRNS